VVNNNTTRGSSLGCLRILGDLTLPPVNMVPYQQ